ncbi:retrovirus-related pol polyprotein from transposon TNT 1-94 [Tanacetum coccineum]
MSGIMPLILPPPFGTSSSNPSSPNVNRVDTMPTTNDPINTTNITNVSQSVVDENLPQLLDSRGGSHVINVPAFDAKDFTSWKVRFMVFLDGLEPYLLKTLEDGRFVPMSSLSTSENPLPKLQNQWSNAESRLANQDKGVLNAEYHERALLENQKRFYKRSGKVGSSRKPLDKSKETCFGCGKLGHFQKDCPSNKTSTPSYPSSNNSFNKPKPYTPSFNQTSSQNSGNHQKDYKGKYKGLKAEIVVLTKRIDDMTNGKSEKGKKEKEKSEKGLIAESFDWDDESVSSDDEGTTKIRAFMAIAEDEHSVGKADARSGQWVSITMKKVHRLLSMTDGDERKHVLDYTYIDLHYVEDQRKNLVNKFNLLKQQISLHKSELSKLKNTVSINCYLQNEVIRVNLENESLNDEISDLKKVIKKWTCSKVTLDQLISEQVPRNIVKALGGKGRRKEKISSRDLLFTKANESSSMLAPENTSNSESNGETQEPLPPLPKLIGATPTGTPDSLISLKKTKKALDVPKACSEKKADSSIEQLLLTLMEEVKRLKRQIEIPSGTPLSSSQPSSSKATKQKIWFEPCKHYRLRNHLFDDCYSKPKCSTCGSNDHLTKEHLEHAAVKKTLRKLKAQSPLKSSPKKAPKTLKPFKECKYCRFNDHHSDHYSGCSRHMTGIKQYLYRYSKESGPKVGFGDDSSGDIEGYGSVNCNGITFTWVTYVNGLKHNLINISQLCDANCKVLFTKTQGTIYNQNNEVVLIAFRRRDVYVIDMSSFNKESNACFFAKASPSVNWLWNKILSHLNFKNINNLSKHNLVSGLPSPTFSKDKNCSACEKRKHHRASFKTTRSFSINKSLHLLHMDLFGPVKPQTISHNKYTLVIVDEYSRVKELRSDNGTEFRNHKLEEFYDEKGISQNFSSPCTPEQNGVAERRNITLIEAARTMLNSAKLVNIKILT